MGGIEILAAAVIFMLGAAGLVRGPRRELGVTMSLVVLLAVLTQFDTLVDLNQMPEKVDNMLGGLGLDTDDVLKQRTMVLFLYSAVTILTAFMAYHGQDTLAFKFKEPVGAVNVILGGLVGALNGYLIFGTIWYYLDKLAYPIERYAWFQNEFTDVALDMVRFLPQNLASGMVLSALALALLWWRILR